MHSESELGLLAYTDYTERQCSEDLGYYRDEPSEFEVEQYLPEFISKLDRPKDPFNVPVWIYENAVRRWCQFRAWRTEHYGPWNGHSKCPYCGSSITSKGGLPSPHAGIRHFDLNLCALCGWWRTEEHLQITPGSTEGISIDRRAILRRFDPSQSNLPISVLCNHLDTNRSLLHFIAPYKLEELVAAVFSESMDCEVHHLGGPNDGGVDLLLVESDKPTVVQVKRRQSESYTESVSSIREFLGAMVLGGFARGVFVSTAKRYSRAAEHAASIASNVPGVDYIALVDSAKLLAACNLYSQGRPPQWRANLTRPESLESHASTGWSKFLEISMGHPGWRRSRAEPEISYTLKGVPAVSELADWSLKVADRLIVRWPELGVTSARLLNVETYDRVGKGARLFWELTLSHGECFIATVDFYHLSQLARTGSDAECECDLVEDVKQHLNPGNYH